MKTLDQRIRLLMKESGLGVSEIAAIAGVKPPSVSDWLNGKTKTLKAGPAVHLSKYFKINSLWLTEDAGPMRDKPAQDKGTAEQDHQDAPPSIPILPVAPSKRDVALAEVGRLAGLLDDAGLHRLIERASVLLENHALASTKQTRKSSQ
jgi:transcriptional regulator with XRE-family HTH domain